MQNFKVIFGLGAAGLAAAVAVACSSSSTPATSTSPDAGGDTATGDDGSTGPLSCIPIGAPACNVKGGETCCFDITGFSGTCVQQASCTQPIQVACSGGSSCATGQKCCAQFGGASVAALEDGGLGALGIDASAISAEAGIAGISGAFSGLMINVSCQTACATGAAQECDTAADCPTGEACQTLGALAGDAGAGIDAGAVPAGFGMYTAALTSTKVCVTPTPDGGFAIPDAGTPPVVDAGTDAGAPVDAGTDALTP